MILDLSVIVPLYNEEESLPELYTWIEKVCKAHSISFEVLFIDDGSKDDSWNVVSTLQQNHTAVRGIRFGRNYGKSAALHVGFQACKGDVVITMDADLQDSPDEIPELVRMINDDGYDIVSGWKKDRHDPLTKTIPTKLYNAATRLLTGIKLNDMNCGLKAYKKDAVKSIEVYGEMHRYIPVIAKWAGFRKIGEKVVKHQERKHGVSKFGMERFLNGFLDLLTINFVNRFGRRPMHIFGGIGTASFFAGFGIAGYLIFQKLYAVYYGLHNYREVTDQPLFYLALIAIVMGSQLFLAGFIGEMISRNSTTRNEYVIREEI